MEARIHILLIEDNPTDVLLTEEVLSTGGFLIQNATRLADALDLVPNQPVDVILLDLGLPDSQGLDTLRTLRAHSPHVPVVVLTGRDDDELALQALKQGAQDYLAKGDLQTSSLQRAIRYAIERSGFERLARESENRVHELTAHIDQVLWMFDTATSRFIYISPSYEKMWGKSPQSLLENPRSYMDDIHPLDRERMRREDEVMYRTGHMDTEFRALNPDGSERWLWLRGYPVLEHGKIVRLVGIVEDVSQRRRLAAERDALLSRLQIYIERLPLAYILFDANLCISDWNPTAERIFGYTRDEMLGDGPPFDKIVPRHAWQEVTEICRRLSNGDMEANSVNSNLTKDGRTIICQWFNTPLMEDGRFVGFLSLAQDITQQKSLEAQFRQSQKMEAVGQLAGGVAHDFNNLLTVISGYGEILLSRLKPDDPLRPYVRDMSAAGDRAAALTKQLLAFSRKTVLEPKVLDLNELVRETKTFLERLIGEHIVLSAVLDHNICKVKLDPGQLQQVLMNLAVNARDAMPRGGKLTVETRHVVVDAGRGGSQAEVKPGPYVVLSITDTGTGMSEEVKSRIFEPFYTTKEVGKGTGLGLAVVLGIVKQSDGFITVVSDPGVGTTFHLHFPAVEDKVTAVRPTEALNGRRGSETVLLVEDEDGVRGLAILALQTQGYNVLAAESGNEALRLLQKHPCGIDMLVTDLVMPGMGGRDLAEMLLPRFPRMKILFSSGYTDDVVVRHGVLSEKAAFLQKPYTPLSLARKIREILDGK